MSNQSEKLKRQTPYPLGDPMTGEECLYCKVERGNYQAQKNIMAIWDGTPPRNPRKGERYLSGAKICAYLAPNDFTGENSRYHIAKLVRIQRVERMVITPIEGGEA